MSRPSTKLQLSFSCSSLKDKDLLSKSDPQVFLYVKSSVTKQWNLVGHTEKIKNSLNPVFSEKLTIDYYFEEIQHIKVAVYDIDRVGAQMSDQDFLGQIETTVAACG